MSSEAPISPPIPPTSGAGRAFVRGGPVGDPYRNHRLLTTLLFLILVVPWIPSYLEWAHYAHTTRLLPRQPWGVGRLPLVWVFYAKTQLILAPASAAAALLVARGWVKGGWLVFLVWMAAVFAWLEVDKQTYTRTNVHLHEYAKFLQGPDAARWAGNLDSVRYLAKVGLGLTFQLALVPILIGVLGSGVLWRRWPRTGGPRALRSLALLCVASVVAVAPAQWLDGDRRALQELHALLPFDFRWSAPGVAFTSSRAFTDRLNGRLKPTFDAAWPAVFAGVPLDGAATFEGRANVIFIVVESLRADAMTPAVMPRLCALAGRGMRLENHSAGAKYSHCGLFNLLYARPAINYFATLNRGIGPQACATFKRAAYETHFVNSCDHRNWMQMQAMAGEKTFDGMHVFLGPFAGADHRSMKEVRRLAGEAGAPPRFITAFLMSTHFPYAYPPAFAKRAPAMGANWTLLEANPDRDRAALLNRYHNACEFLDSEIADVVESLDPARNVIVVTGDHGESFWDDGALCHGGRWSDVQFRVPCLIVGPNVAPRRVDEQTVHQDVLPTALHAVAGRGVAMAGTTGRDLLGGGDAPAYTVLCSESTPDYSDFLIRLRGPRRLRVELRPGRREFVILGTADALGRVDPFDVPPVAEADEWARALADLFRLLTAPRSP